MLVSRTGLWLSVRPAMCFNGSSTHRASLVRRMLITVQHLATLFLLLPLSHTQPHLHTDVHVLFCTHRHTKRCTQTVRTHAKIHVSKRVECKCNHKQISSHSTRHAHEFRDAHTLKKTLEGTFLPSAHSFQFHITVSFYFLLSLQT